MPRWFLPGLVLFVVVFVAIAALVAANHREDGRRDAPAREVPLAEVLNRQAWDGGLTA